MPLGKGFAAEGRVTEKKVQFETVSLYDSGLNKVKEIARYRFFYQMSGGGKKCEAVEVRGIQFQASGAKLFFKTGDEQYTTGNFTNWWKARKKRGGRCI